MSGMDGEDEEHPASNNAGATGQHSGDSWKDVEDVHNRTMATAIRIIRM